MDKKRVAIAILFLAIVAVIGYAIYRVFFAAEGIKPVRPTTPGGEVPTGEFPSAGEGEIKPGTVTPGVLPPGITRPGTGVAPAKKVPLRETKIVQTKIISPSVDSNGRTQFFNQGDGKFYRIKQDGTTETLSDQVFYNIKEVTWSPATNESIIEYPDGSNIYYNFDSKQQVTLPKHWEEFSFTSTGDQIAAKSIALAPENRWLVASDPNGSNIQFVEALGENASKVTVDWSPTKKIVALSRTGDPLGADRQEVIMVGLNGENFKSMTVEGRDLRSQWSPTGKQLLYSVYSARSDFKPELWIANADGDDMDTNRRPLLLNTWADKCVFADERYVYCGVPATLDTGAGFQPSLADTTQDQFYKIDLISGNKTTIQTDQVHVVDKIFISDNGTKLQFTDKLSDGLFTINI